MKIAVAVTEDASLSEHFGRSAGFLVFDLEDGRLNATEFRANPPAASVEGGCGHDHAGMAAILRDCKAVLCGGMGSRAAEAFRACGIEPAIVKGAYPPNLAVALYMAGQLSSSADHVCQCHHH